MVRPHSAPVPGEGRSRHHRGPEPVVDPQSADRLGRRIRFIRTRKTWPFRSEEHTSELQSLMRISYAVFCLKKKKKTKTKQLIHTYTNKNTIHNNTTTKSKQ